MQKLAIITILAGAALLGAPAAGRKPARPIFRRPAARRARPLPPPADANRTPAQQQMSPDDAARDQQLQVLEARTGNTSLGAERGGPFRQLDKTGGSFTVRKFRALPGQDQKKGESRRVRMGGRTTGKPLVHEHGKKKKFLFF